MVLKERQRLRLIKEVLDSRNWKINNKRICERTGLSYKTVRYWLNMWEITGRIKYKVFWVKDEDFIKKG